jgi:hypothetical protein
MQNITLPYFLKDHLLLKNVIFSLSILSLPTVSTQTNQPVAEYQINGVPPPHHFCAWLERTLISDGAAAAERAHGPGTAR